MIKIFEIDEFDNVIIAPEVRFIKEFKKIIERDRGSKGDAQGRKKMKAMKELVFVYFMCDYHSRYANVPESDKKEQIATDLELDNFNIDEDIHLALEKYKSLQETPSLKILGSIKKTLFTSHKLCDILTDQLEDDIKGGKHKEVTYDSKGNPVLGTTQMVENLNNILAIAKTIPATIDTMDKLEDKIKKELQQDSKIRGGGRIGEFED